MSQQNVSKKKIRSIMKQLGSEGRTFKLKEIQILVQNALDIIQSLPERKNSSALKLKNELYESAGKAIQAQIKHFITKIQENLTKFWSSQKEQQLNQYLIDCRDNWLDIKKFFPSAPNTAVDWLIKASNLLLEELKVQRFEIELPELLDEISSQEKYWPSRKVDKAVDIANYLNQKGEIISQIEIIAFSSAQRAIEGAQSYKLLIQLPGKFPILEQKSIPKKLNQIYSEKKIELYDLEVEENIIENLEQLEKAINESAFWPQLIEKNLIELLAHMPNDHHQLSIGLQMLKLFKYYLEQIGSGNQHLESNFPELFYRNKTEFTPIEFTEDGEYNISVLYNSEWLPAYQWEEKKVFPFATFVQEGEWKKRKFKCEWWKISGKIPIGSIFMVSNKKEKIYYITTHNDNKFSDHLRVIDLTDNDVLSIKEFQKIIKTTNLNNVPSISSNFPFFQLFRNSKMIKLGIRFANLDRKYKTIFAIGIMNALKGNSKIQSIVEKQKHVIKVLFDAEEGKSEKYLRFVEKNLLIPTELITNLLKS